MDKLDLTLEELTALAKKEKREEHLKRVAAAAAAAASAKPEQALLRKNRPAKPDAAAAATTAATAAEPGPALIRKIRTAKPAAAAAAAVATSIDVSSSSSSSKPPLTTGTPVIFANLNEDVEADELQEIVEEELKVKLKSASKLRFNGRWHACRLVFRKKSDAERAVAEFNERQLDGRPMKVSLQAPPLPARERSAPPPSNNNKRQRESRD